MKVTGTIIYLDNSSKVTNDLTYMKDTEWSENIWHGVGIIGNDTSPITDIKVTIEYPEQHDGYEYYYSICPTEENLTSGIRYK